MLVSRQSAVHGTERYRAKIETYARLILQGSSDHDAPNLPPPPGCIVWSDGTIYGLFPTLRILPAGSRTHAPKSLSYLPIGTKGVL